MMFQGVTWFISGHRGRASSRLQGYLIHEHLLKIGYPSELFLAPPFNVKDVPWALENLQAVADSVQTSNVVFQKLYGERTEHLISLLRAKGIKTIFVECDYYPDRKTPYHCDVIMVTSEFLYEEFSKNGAECALISDPIEEIISYEAMIKRFDEKRNGEGVKLVWIGHRQNWQTLKPIRDLLTKPEFNDYQLITISSHEDADFQWQLNTVGDLITQGDIGIVPAGSDIRYQAKSNNRLTLFMALGLPVIADCIPSYEKIVKNGQNGFLCQSREDWQFALDYLRNPIHRFDMARNAYKNSVPPFKLERVVKLWLAEFESTEVNESSRQLKHSVDKPTVYQAQLDVEQNLNWTLMSAKRRCWKKTLSFGSKATIRALSNKKAFENYIQFLRRLKAEKAT